MSIFHVIKYYPRGDLTQKIFWEDMNMLIEELPEVYKPWRKKYFFIHSMVGMDKLKEALLNYEDSNLI